MTDSRTNEPKQTKAKSSQDFVFSEVQVETAAKLMWKERALGTTTPDYPWRGLAEEGRERLRAHAREVLEAAMLAGNESDR